MKKEYINTVKFFNKIFEENVKDRFQTIEEILKDHIFTEGKKIPDDVYIKKIWPVIKNILDGPKIIVPKKKKKK
ncbi:hypothetical protein ACFL2K_05415 [Candidatus Margulisiibacteriota bacterium]